MANPSASQALALSLKHRKVFPGKAESMIPNPDLHRIQIGLAPAAEARKTFRVRLQDPKGQELALAAARAWTWKTLTSRRFDRGLQDWFRVMRGAQAFLTLRNPILAGQFGLLSDLLYASILMAEANGDEALLKRNHVRPLLLAVRRNNGTMRRKQIAEVLRVSDSQLSQLLTLLCSRGLLERNQFSREAEFTLTRAGEELLQALEGRGADKALAKADKSEAPLPSAAEIVKPQTPKDGPQRLKPEADELLNRMRQFRSDKFATFEGKGGKITISMHGDKRVTGKRKAEILGKRVEAVLVKEGPDTHVVFKIVRPGAQPALKEFPSMRVQASDDEAIAWSAEHAE